MATCPNCAKKVTPEKDPQATPTTGDGLAAVTWVCPECDVILSVSEVNFF